MKIQTVRELIQHQARERPQQTYITFPHKQSPSQSLTFSELNHRSMAISNYLISLKLQKGDLVMLAFSNGINAIEWFFATQYSGLMVCLLNLVGQSQWDYIINHSQPRLIVTDSTYMEKIDVAVKQLEKKPIILSTIATKSFFEEYLQLPQSDYLPIPISPTDPSVLMYTSGTTGNPKGVLLSHQNVLAGGRNTMVAHEIDSSDRGLCVLPLYHINAQMVSVMSSLVSGGSIVLPETFSVNDFWRIISQYHCTWFSVVPTQINYLIHRSSINHLDLSSLKFGRSASAPLSPEVHKNFEKKFGINLVETMGLTETSAQILSNPRNREEQKYGTPGRGVGNEVKIVQEGMIEVLPGEIGEIAVKGDNVMIGYLNNPQATTEAIVDGWLLTGDLGYQDEDGFVFITGRKKEIIIKGGENISPREIDDVIYQLPEVIETACFAIPCQNYGQQIAVAVVCKPNTKLDQTSIISHCHNKLGKFKTPSHVYFLDDLPKGPSGKIQRNKIIDWIKCRAREKRV